MAKSLCVLEGSEVYIPLRRWHEVQLCIVHLVRASLNYMPWKARKPVAADLQLIYRASTRRSPHGMAGGKVKMHLCPSGAKSDVPAMIHRFLYCKDLAQGIELLNKASIICCWSLKVLGLRAGRFNRLSFIGRKAGWFRSQPAWLTPERIQPLLAGMSSSVIASQICVSRWYAERIRQGYRPHPRHWQTLARLVNVNLTEG